MASLSKEHQRAVVVELAHGASPTEVVEFVKETFGLDITRQQVRHYNPEQNPDCGKQWQELYEGEKARFDAEMVSIARQSVRLNRLQHLIYLARKRGALKLEAELIEQAAKEAGGAFTNKREVTGKGGAAMQMKIEVTPDDTDYRKAAAALAPLPEPPPEALPEDSPPDS